MLRFINPLNVFLLFCFFIHAVISLTPKRFESTVSLFLGRLYFSLVPKRKVIAKANIDVCFDYLTVDQRNSLLDDFVVCFGRGLLLTSKAWWKFSSSNYWNGFEVSGVEELLQDKLSGKSVFILGYHHAAIELIGRSLVNKIPISFVVHPQKNSISSFIINMLRSTKSNPISRYDVKKLLQAIKQKDIVCMYPDHDIGLNGSVQVDFMGKEACTTTSFVKLVKRFSGVVYMPVIDSNASVTKVQLKKVDLFLDKDIKSSVTRMNFLVSEQIKKDPANYLWSHKRFKNSKYKAIY